MGRQAYSCGFAGAWSGELPQSANSIAMMKSAGFVAADAVRLLSGSPRERTRQSQLGCGTGAHSLMAKAAFARPSEYLLEQGKS
jgi:hypothetical protein